MMCKTSSRNIDVGRGFEGQTYPVSVLVLLVYQSVLGSASACPDRHIWIFRNLCQIMSVTGPISKVSFTHCHVRAGVEVSSDVADQRA